MTPIRRVDANHAAIRDGLREAGYWVWDTHELGNGFPDLIAMNDAGEFALLEIKVPGEKLTDKEQIFFHELIEEFRCRRLFVVHNIEQALEAMNA